MIAKVKRVTEMAMKHILKKIKPASSRRSASFAKEVTKCAKRFAQAERDLNDFKNAIEPSLRTLANHKTRLLQILERNNAIIGWLSNRCNEWAPADAVQMEERNQELHTAIGATEAKLQSLRGEQVILESEYEVALHKLLDHFADIHATERTPRDQGSIVSDNMIQPEMRDEFAEDCTQFEEIMAEDIAPVLDAAEVDREWDDDIDYELMAEQKATEQLTFDWTDAHAEKRRLESLPAHECDEDELEETTKRVVELGVQLALRGMPIRNGEWIGKVSDSENVSAITPYTAENRPASADEVRSVDVSMDLVQHCNADAGGSAPERAPQCIKGLFDEAVGIEKPSVNDAVESGLAITEGRGKAAIDERSTMKTMEWLNALADVTDVATDPHNESVCGEVDSTIDKLLEPDANDSVSCRGNAGGLTTKESFALETRRQAWAIQLACDQRQLLEMVRDPTPWIELPPDTEEQAAVEAEWS